MTSLIEELKRRNVFRVALFYGVSSWLLLQIADLVFELLLVPDWTLRFIFGVLLAAFPFVLFLAWAYELTPEGLKRESEVSRSESIAPRTGKRLDRLIIGIMAAVILVLLADRVVTTPASESEPPANVDESVDLAAEKASATGGATGIAVLPFQNMSADAANEFFADGISEEILNLLAGVRELEVASRTSSFAFKGKDSSVPEIARELKVRYVLEGSVRKAGDQVRITAQLIDAETDRHLWSDTYDRTLRDIFAVQDEIAAAIGEALQVRLLKDSGERVSAESMDPAIYEAFLEARFLMRRRSPAALERASVMLEEVVEREPEFARALALLAEVYVLGRLGSSHAADDLRERIGSLAERAGLLDPTLAGVPLIFGELARDEERMVDAYRHYRQAIELEPGEPRPHHWMALLLSGSGHLDQALASIDEAIRLEPQNANAHGWRSTLLAAQGRWEEAISEAQRQVELGNPNGYLQMGIYQLRENPDEAERSFQRAEDEGEPMAGMAELVVLARGEEAARERLLAEMNSGELAGENAHYGIKQAFLTLGLHEAFLQAAVAAAEEVMSDNTLMWGSEAQSLRQDPRFIEFMARRGYLPLWDEIGPPPGCRREEGSYRCGLGASR